MDASFLQILLYVLGSILLIALIVLVIKLVYSINRVNNILDNVEMKMKTFDKAFSAIDKVVDSFSLVSDRLVDGVAGMISKVLKHKKTSKNIKLKKEEE